MSDSTHKDTEFTVDSAQELFYPLLADYRTSALWFLRPDQVVSRENPLANRVIDELAIKAPRSSWVKVRKLKKWRSLHFK